MKTRYATLGLVASVALLGHGAAWAEQPLRMGATVEPVMQTSTDAVGQPIAYPPGAAVVTAAIVHLEQGVSTGWHLHEVPFFAQVLEGELTVDYGTKGLRVYSTGDTLVEAVDWPHNGTNTGSGPVRILAVYMGSDSMKNSVLLPHP
ncbi:cupin domain-containing protein [Frigidibacter albus]|uniref:Cupin domain-containing protein n=1 Tax=Frigidibacter albus TaxID=1465486 RepID=A0A6L8VKF0_9RHOB|nr:cupin domain-containing protein [Frigidibacter albus]MZQ90196.1 cupin domain-containing protein [Frigidibacter albus]NBE32306.1 cupin domain-containing protein [Frigidibacter albus]GGH58077.1 hypothetical protein GCM10011341_28110 [Frigidibacter albus]